MGFLWFGKKTNLTRQEKITSEQFMGKKIKEIVIPKNITEIQNHAFCDCKKLKEVTIPESVTTIGTGAFAGCMCLQSIILPKGIKEIPISLFANCKNIKKINIPNSVSKIGRNAFLHCYSLREVNIPTGVKEINEAAFGGCYSLKGITIPDSVEKIEGYAFSGCKSLEEITIPEGVSSIDENTFRCCESLTKVNLPSTVTQIGNNAFEGCDSLREITIPEGVSNIDEKAFLNCKSLTKINLPSTLTQIGMNAFEGCDSLREITIPEGVSIIDKNTFRCCKSLTKINLPSTLMKIGWYAFDGCNSLKELTISSNNIKINSLYNSGIQKLIIAEGVTEIKDFAFSALNVEEVILPSTLKTIGDSALHLNERIKEITIPEGVTKIERDVFHRCQSLESITILNSNIDFDSRGISSDCKINLKTTNGNIVSFNPYLLNAFSIKELGANSNIKQYNTLLKKVVGENFNKEDANIVEFAKLCKILGLFEPKNSTVKLNGKDMKTSDIAYALLQRWFVINKQVNFNELHGTLSQLGVCSYNEAFLKFMSDKNNCSDMLSSLSDLPTIYSWFNERENMEINSNTELIDNIPTTEENRYKIRHFAERPDGTYKDKWSLPTYQLIMEELSNKAYMGINYKNIHIANELQKHSNYKEQKFFDKAVEIDEERQKLVAEGKISNNLLSKPLRQYIDNAFEDYKKRTKEMSNQILDNCAEALRDDADIEKYIFSYEMLSKDSPENFAIGCYTSCCARLYGAGAGAQRAMIIHPDIQPLVIRNRNGEIVAFSILYINREQGYAVANDLEVNFKYEGNKKAVSEIYTRFKQGVEAFVKAYNEENDIPIKQVNCGISPNWRAKGKERDIVNSFIEMNERGEVLDAVDFSKYKYMGDGYWPGDWQKEQYVIWKQGGNKNERGN